MFMGMTESEAQGGGIKFEREKILKVLVSPPELDGISVRLEKLEAIFNESRAEEIAEIREKVEALGRIMYGRNHEVDDAIHRKHVLALLPEKPETFRRYNRVDGTPFKVWPGNYRGETRDKGRIFIDLPNTRKEQQRKWPSRRIYDDLSSAGGRVTSVPNDLIDRRIEDRRAEAS